LLVEAGFEFEAVSPRVQEKFDVDLTLRELTLWNAIRKGMSVAQMHPDKVILAADTLVALEDEIIGKPKDLNEAAKMLRRLSGRRRYLVRRKRLPYPADQLSATYHEFSRVTFRRLNSAKIKSYFAKVDPLDKAGAYAAQGIGAEIIEKIDGSYTNVVGLPMERTLAALAEFGVSAKSG